MNWKTIDVAGSWSPSGEREQQSTVVLSCLQSAVCTCRASSASSEGPSRPVTGKKSTCTVAAAFPWLLPFTPSSLDLQGPFTQLFLLPARASLGLFTVTVLRAGGTSYKWCVPNARANSIGASASRPDFSLINIFKLISVTGSEMNLKLKRDSDCLK